MPKVTVILTSYNHAKYIRETIDSILNQTFKDFELIIWDDASTDKSWEIIQSYDDPRIKRFQSERTEGGLINKALLSGEVQGEYIAIHHSDDVWELTKLEKQVKVLDENSEYGAVFTHVQVIDEYANKSENHWFNVENDYNRFTYLKDAFNGCNRLCHPSALIRKKVYEEVGFYKYGLAQTGDMEMWIRISLSYEIFVLPEKLTLHRKFTDESNTSGARPDVFIRMKNEFFILLDNYLSIKDFGFLSRIFPEIKTFAQNDQFVSEYCLAIISLKSIFEVTKIFGIKLLYNLINDEEKALKIKLFYNFDYIDLIKISSQYNLINSFSQELNETRQELNETRQELNETRQELNETRQELKQKEQNIKNLNDELISIYMSKSWKITSPLRSLFKKLRKGK